MRTTLKAIARQQKKLRRSTKPTDGDWFQKVQDQEPLRQQLQNGSPETSTGWAPSVREGWLGTLYDTLMALGSGNGAGQPQLGGPSAIPGATRGNRAAGETALAAQGLYTQLTSNRNVPLASAQNATPVRRPRSAGDHSDDADPGRFLHDLDHERTFYTMLFSPGLRTLGYEPDEKFEYDVTVRDGDRITEERKTLTAVGVVRYLLVRKVEKLQGLTKRGRDLVFEVQRHKGKQAKKLFSSKEALKKVQHHSVHRGVKAIERLLKTQGIKGTDKATLRAVVARSRLPSAINLTYRGEGDIGAVLDVETRGGIMSFAILPTSDELIRYLGDAAERDNWVRDNGETAFFSSNFNFRDSAFFTTATVEGTEDQPLDTVSSCLRHALTPVVNNRIMQQQHIPRVLLERNR
jgi:hypothetical protein